jgi:hypothetical protein
MREYMEQAAGSLPEGTSWLISTPVQRGRLHAQAPDAPRTYATRIGPKPCGSLAHNAVDTAVCKQR